MTTAIVDHVGGSLQAALGHILVRLRVLVFRQVLLLSQRGHVGPRLQAHGHLLHVGKTRRVKHGVRVLRGTILARIQRLATLVVLLDGGRHGRVAGVDEAVAHASFPLFLFRLGLHLWQLEGVTHSVLITSRLKVRVGAHHVQFVDAVILASTTLAQFIRRLARRYVVVTPDLVLDHVVTMAEQSLLRLSYQLVLKRRGVVVQVAVTDALLDVLRVAVVAANLRTGHVDVVQVVYMEALKARAHRHVL